jgi:hypothetical protein
VSNKQEENFAWKDFRYAGWVPTTTGHLSFSAIGSSVAHFYYGARSWKRRKISGDQSEDIDIFAFQWRPNPDQWYIQRLGSFLREWRAHRSALKSNSSGTREAAAESQDKRGKFRKWLREFFPLNSTQYFILFGRTASANTPYLPPEESAVPSRSDAFGMMIGHIYMLFRKPGLEDAKWHKLIADLKLASKCSQDHAGTEQFDVAVKSICSALNEQENGVFVHASTKVSFTLFRTGELRIGKSDDRFANDDATDPQIEVPAAHNQAYLFIKDMLHRHHHHPPAADQCLQLKATDETDLNWRRQTLWDLAKVAGSMRRRASLVERRNAVGVTAYAEAFQNLLAKIKRDENGKHISENSLATYNFAFQQRSISAENEAHAFSHQGAGAVFLAIMAALMSLTVIHHSSSSIQIANGLGPACILDTSFDWYIIAGLLSVGILAWDSLYGRHQFMRRRSNDIRAWRTWMAKNPAESLVILVLFWVLIVAFWYFGLFGNPMPYLTNLWC